MTTYANCEDLSRAVRSCGVNDGSDAYRKCLQLQNVDLEPVSCRMATPSTCENEGYTETLHGCTASSAVRERVHVRPTRGSPSWVFQV